MKATQTHDWVSPPDVFLVGKFEWLPFYRAKVTRQNVTPTSCHLSRFLPNLEDTIGRLICYSCVLACTCVTHTVQSVTRGPINYARPQREGQAQAKILFLTFPLHVSLPGLNILWCPYILRMSRGKHATIFRRHFPFVLRVPSASTLSQQRLTEELHWSC